jgi:hypothetical protein
MLVPNALALPKTGVTPPTSLNLAEYRDRTFPDHSRIR